MAKLHEAFCACCSGNTAIFHRRQFLRVVGIGGAILAFAPDLALAAEGEYEAMVLACIDPRMQEPVHRYTVEQNLTGKFSQFVIAGAAIGVVAPAFQDWHKAFWDNLATTIQLHRIKKVIAIDHRDCGAAKIAYGEARVATPQAETKTHRAALTEFRKQVGERHPQLGVQTGLMALDGKMEMFS
jgi:carbonic anhydrase